MSQCHGYLIDVMAQTITPFDFDGLADLQRAVGGSIEAAANWANGDVLFVDEEGLYKHRSGFWLLPERPDQMLAGNGVLVGREAEGPYPNGYTNLPPTMTLEQLTQRVVFL